MIAGTGLGAAVCIPTGHGVVVLPTEAGMAAFAPGSTREMEILAWLRKQGHRHVCTEQLLSGPGAGESVSRVGQATRHAGNPANTGADRAGRTARQSPRTGSRVACSAACWAA